MLFPEERQNPPSILYRYRPPEYVEHLLRNRYMYAPLAKSFNDILDCSVYLNLDEDVATMLKVVQHMAKESKNPKCNLAKWVRHVKEKHCYPKKDILDEIIDGTLKNCRVICFTDSEDNEKAWKLHALDCSGVCMGFNTDYCLSLY